MTKPEFATTGLCAILILALCLPPWSAQAGDGQQDRTGLLPVNTTTFKAPIGVVESLGAMLINGRVTFGQASIWGSELIQTPAEMSARVQLDAIGQVTLAPGTIARLAASPSLTRPDSGRRDLILSLVSGEAKAQLLQEAGAYIEAGGQSFIASEGANLRVGVLGGVATSEATSGTVRPGERPGQQFRKGIAMAAGNNLSVGKVTDRDFATVAVISKRGESLPIAIKVVETSISDNQSSGTAFVPGTVNAYGLAPPQQRQKKDKKEYSDCARDGCRCPEQDVIGKKGLENIRVRFEVITANLGSIQPREAETDGNGIAKALFTGAEAGPGSIKVTIIGKDGTEECFYWKLDVRGNISTLRRTILIAAGAGAAGAVLVLSLDFRKRPIQPIPPPVPIP